jgi:hypothetical protein
VLVLWDPKMKFFANTAEDFISYMPYPQAVHFGTVAGHLVSWLKTASQE